MVTRWRKKEGLEVPYPLRQSVLSWQGLLHLSALIALAKPLSAVAIKFGPAEYFSLMLLGLGAVSGLAGNQLQKH